MNPMEREEESGSLRWLREVRGRRWVRRDFRLGLVY